MSSVRISWLDGRTGCYWPGLDNKNFSFYRRVKRADVEYEVGSGVYVPGLLPKSKDVAQIHCFYENGETVKPSDRYRAIIEIFLPPKRYEKLAKENGILLCQDIEVIQDGKARFYNIAIEQFLGKCHLVFSMAHENPEMVLVKHFKKHTEPTYICRLKLNKVGNTPVFNCVISNETIKKKDDDCVIIEEKYFKVTAVECNENSVKMKLARHETKQPMVLLDKINLDNYSSPPKSTKENNSRRKQVLNKKMYNDDCENIELENVVNKIKNIGIVTPKKTPQRRTRTKSTDSIENEPLKKTPKKTKENKVTEKKPNKVIKNVTPKKKQRSNDSDLSESEPLKKTPKKNTEVDSIVDKIKTRLSIITPQKTPQRGTPVRRRLESLNEEEIQPKTPLRKSTRISACTKNLGLDLSDDEPLTTRRKSQITKKSDLSESEDETKRRKPIRMSIKKSTVQMYESDSEDDLKKRKSMRMSLKNTPSKINTPKKTPSRIKVSTLTATVERRAASLHIPDDALEQARSQLRNTMKREEKVGCLPCREKEYEDIETFIEGKLKDRAGGCMYISGVPGTGKTATVNRVICSLKHGYQFKAIMINALSLTEPRQVYVEIMKQLKGCVYRWDEALDQLRSHFCTKKHETHLLIIDELDKLCTRKQDVIYNLLDLPANSRTPLIVLAIANTMDLPERLLSNKVNSRLGLTRISFRPYKFNELADIVKRKLGSNKAFRSEAIEFVARKVAAVSGDARRAIAICARCTEMAESLGSKDVTMDIVNRTLADAAGTNAAKAVRSLSVAQKTILRAIAHEVERTGNDEVNFCDVVRVANEFNVLDGVSAFMSGQLLSASQTLRAMRLIIGQDGSKDVGGTILLNISPDDVHYALKND